MNNPPANDRLTGVDLLLAIRAAGPISRAQLLRITGYVRLQEDGREQLDSTAFHQALLEAARTVEAPSARPSAESQIGLPPGEGGSGQSGNLPGDQPRNLHQVNEQILKTLVKTVIALPLLDRINAERMRRQQGDAIPAAVHDVIIGLHQDFPKGRESARRWLINTIEEIIESQRALPKQAPESLDSVKRKITRQYLFARLTGESLRQLVLRDAMSKQLPVESHPILEHLDDPASREERNRSINSPAIFQIWEDFKIYPLLHGSVATVKADAACTSFGASGEGIVWAVIDSGIQADHPHFAAHSNLHGQVDEWHADFTGGHQPLQDEFGHGTHVAGILAGEIKACAEPSPEGNPQILAYLRSFKLEDGQEGREITCERLPLAAIRGVAPATKLVSMKVIDANKQGSVSNIIAALARVQEINANGRNLRIHGINLSVGYPFDPEWFACGQSQLCVEVNRLVQSGVVVVVAAGNTGYGSQATAFNGARAAGLTLSINDPGNAEGAITVGSTHRTKPHTYGVSYFSSKGPTGDGRIKPDLLAPGEKILSCGVGSMAAAIASKLANGVVPNYVEDSGTSMAAPHVSGAAAAFLSIRNEFIGKPAHLKEIFMATATDLKRERQFQGAGLLDLMRAIQSV